MSISYPLILEQDVIRDLHETAQQLRVDSVRCAAAASSGHPTSSMSAADLMAGIDMAAIAAAAAELVGEPDG
jgi:transketolase N-terminal domain/subunit